MKKSFRLVRLNGILWVMSNWTGEIVRPWEFRKIISMIRDFSIEPLY